MSKLSLRTAARIAWRETRSSMVKFLFVVLAVAAGVGSLAGVRGFSETFRSMLLRDARQLMAADLSARMFEMPSEAQQKGLEQMAARGIGNTWVTETISMASGRAETPALISLKAVEPDKYPYYGQERLRPEMSLAQALTDESVVVAEDLLIRLQIEIGDLVRVGGDDFRVAAVVVNEPDRMTGSLNVGLRMMMSREALDRTGLIKPGARGAQRFLFKLGPQVRVEEARGDVRRLFPNAMVADFRQTHPLITRGLNRSTMFLSLVSLIALIVGALGVGMAMHAHLQRKLDNIAVMKSLGAASREIMRIYLLQTLMLGLAGGIAGVAVGKAIEAAFPLLIARYFSLRPETNWNLSAAWQGIGVGLLTTLLFTLPPLLAIRRVRPALVLRRGMDEAKPPLRKRLKEWRASIGAGVLILAGIGGIAAWLADSPRMGGYFAGGLVGSLIGLSLVAWLMLRTIRFVLKRTPRKLPLLVRHGMLNLYRQGSQAQAILVALGLGVMFTLTVYLVQDSLVREIARTAPPGMPNVFLIGVTSREVDDLVSLIDKHTGTQGKAELSPVVSAQLLSIDNVKISDINLKGRGRRYRQAVQVMWEPELPEHYKVLQGNWWTRNTTENVASVVDETAKEMGVKVGSILELTSYGKTFTAKVVATHQTESIRARPTTEFVFSRPALEGLPVIFMGGVRMKPETVGTFQRAAYDKFPTVTVINVADALALIQEVVDQIALVIRFLSVFAILAGAIILAAAVAGTRFRRIREVAILKTLGATRRYVARIFSVEFLALGAVAGLMGSLLASVFSSLLLRRFLEAEFQFDGWATAAAMALTALLANVSGWLASFRILGQKPLEVLRDE